MGKVDFFSRDGLEVRKSGKEEFIGRYLKGSIFVVTALIANKGLSLTIFNILINIGVDKYLFVSEVFTNKIIKYLGA